MTRTPELPGSSKRRVQRRSIRCFVWLGLDEGGRRVEHGLARGVDITSRGIGLVLPKPIALGRRIFLEMRIGSALYLRARGTAVHCVEGEKNQYRAGIVFDEPPSLVDVEGVPGES